MTLQEMIVYEVSHRYPKLLFVFFYGSQLVGDHHAASDIDVICVIDEQLPPFRERFTAGGQVFDSFVFDPGSLHAAMRQSYRGGSFTLTQSICAAQTLPQPTLISDQLKRIANDIVRTGDVNLSRAIFMARHRLGSAVTDLAQCRDSDRVAICTAAYRMITDGLLLHFNGGIQGAKHGGRFLQECMKADYAHLQESLRNALTGDATALRNWANKTLTMLGGQLGDEFRDALPHLPRIPLQ